MGSSGDTFRQMFFEEARELMVSLEAGLMDLERRKGDRAHLDRTFRAAHSLKGAAAMVGLEAIARFTHGIEAVLERIRSGKLAVDSEMITTLLESRDHLASMVEGEAAGLPISASDELTHRLDALLRGGNTPAEPVTDKPHWPNVYRIKLTPGAEMLCRGINPLGVLDELGELGMTTISTDPGLVPCLDEIDPERCYLAWTVLLESDVEPDRLNDAFLFVAADSTIEVEQRESDGTFKGITLNQTMTEQTPAPTAAATSQTAPGDSKEPVVPIRPSARIRVDALQLDRLVDLAGELVVLADSLQHLREEPRAARWLHALEGLERVSREIRDTTLDLRMVPVEELFSRFPRVVRDLADRSGKEIELRINGQETRLDRTIVERLGDPMIHLIRNAVDHALEPPEERLAKGKPRSGLITLTAGYEGDRVTIRVEDDGRGLDREAIVRKGIARGLIPIGVSAEDPRVIRLIFEPGFSTRDDVSELSGRGVGLDVVHDSVRALRGNLSVESVPGQGTSFIFRLPLTLALIDGLIVETSGAKFVVPLTQVEECVSLNDALPALAKERPYLTVRGELVPIVSPRQLFRSTHPVPARQELLLTRHAGQRVGVVVDRLVGRVQAVIQSLGEGMRGMSRFTGATILGDGTVSLILDLSVLVSESLVRDHGVPQTLSTGERAESLS